MMSMLQGSILQAMPCTTPEEKPTIQVPFNLPFSNALNFNEVIPAAFDGTALFRGKYAALVHKFFKTYFDAPEVVPTASCTNALELAALLLDIKKGDEVILPAYTYVSTANAFELRGAKLRLCDSLSTSPNIDLNKIESLITPRTKAMVVIHYGGVSVNMYKLQEIAQRHKIALIEDAAHAIDAYYDGKRLGTFGDLATFSFHETKNITSGGQGGLLVINNEQYVGRARILRDCGTNRHNFYLGLVDKYTWVDVGSVYNLSELSCSYLYPQLLHLEMITQKRRQLWNNYYQALGIFQENGYLKLPFVSDLTEHNAHIFYLTLNSQDERDRMLKYLKERGVVATFHYSGLHQCPYYQRRYPKVDLPNAGKFSGRLLRLPLYYDMSPEQQLHVLNCIDEFFHAPKPKNKTKTAFALPFFPLVSFSLGDQSLLFNFVCDMVSALG